MRRVPILLLLAASTVGPLTGEPMAMGEPIAFSEAPLPHALIRRAQGEITIDGRLDEFSWVAAPQINRFHRVTVGTESGDLMQATRARMLWDDEGLYVAFACRDTDIWALFDKEDDPMWSEEVVEVFIDPDGDGRHYLELEVNPLNALVDLHVTSIQPEWISDLDWDIAGVKTAVDVIGTVNDASDTDVGWTTEILIPWKAFLPEIAGGERPGIGDHWRLNLYRIDRGAGARVRQQLVDLDRRIAGLREQMPAAADTTELADQIQRLWDKGSPLKQEYELATEYSAWSPTLHPGFHNPSRFGIVEFAP